LKKGIRCEAPLKNLGIGKQLQWYNASSKNFRKEGKNMRKPLFEEVWKRIVSCEGEEFKTVSNLPFKYEVRGDYLLPNRTDYNI